MALFIKKLAQILFSQPMIKYTIRRAEEKDIAAMLGLVKELAEFEKAPHEVITSESQMLEDGFGTNSIFKAFVAESDDDGEIMGMALYYTAYSTWKGKIYFLDDIVVKEKYRQLGIGRKLINEMIKEAAEKNIPQIRWQVLDWNEPAIKFYESLGVFIDKEWYTCKMSAQNMKDYISTIK